MSKKSEVYEYLDKMSVAYRVTDHPPIHTIEALDEYDIKDKEKIAKNLFLRNDNGKKHYLVTVRQDKQVNLQALREKIGSSRLSFASEERLFKCLNLTKGSVTPLGVINDKDKKVEVYFDEDLVDEEVIGVHPNENDATVWISFNQLKSIILSNGNHFGIVKID